MNIKEAVVGTIITVVIGGTVYSINQEDVIKNFAEDTGLTQQQAEQYVEGLDESDLATFEEIGQSHIDEGEDIISVANEIDCTTYTYEWESSSLPCSKAKEQLNKVGKDSISLGRAYQKLDSDSASEEDMALTINLIDTLNLDYDLDIIKFILEDIVIDEVKKTSSYNRALIKAALESDD